MTEQTSNTERVDIRSIRPHGRNPRKITKQALERLKRSIQEFPEMLRLRPIVVDENGVIIGGNQRYAALCKLGHTHVWITRATELTEKQKREFMLRDNVSAGEWDVELLRSEYADLALDDIGIDLPDAIAPASTDDIVQEDTRQLQRMYVLFSAPISNTEGLAQIVELASAFPHIEMEQAAK